MTVETAFKRAAAGFLIAVFAGCNMTMPLEASHPEKPIDISALVPEGKVCVSPAQIRRPQDDIQRYASKLYNRAMGGLGSDVSTICFDRALDKKNACGAFRLGNMKSAENILSLNPAISRQEMESTIQHESRHRTQHLIGLSSTGNENIPEAQRVVMKLIMEADARLYQILRAHQEEREGRPGHALTIRADAAKAPMLKAYEESLGKNQNDIPAAMRAGFLEFAKLDFMKYTYANSIISWIMKNDMAFDPARSADNILSNEILQKFGQVGMYNYMDKDLMNTIRTAIFTDKDYKRLVKLRQESGGVRGAACGLAGPAPGSAGKR
jgi:hypothetical protein